MIPWLRSLEWTRLPDALAAVAIALLIGLLTTPALWRWLGERRRTLVRWTTEVVGY